MTPNAIIGIVMVVVIVAAIIILQIKNRKKD